MFKHLDEGIFCCMPGCRSRHCDCKAKAMIELGFEGRDFATLPMADRRRVNAYWKQFSKRPTHAERVEKTRNAPPEVQRLVDRLFAAPRPTMSREATTGESTDRETIEQETTIVSKKKQDRVELTPQQQAAVKDFMQEKAARDSLSAGELQTAAQLGVTARAFIGLRAAHNKIAGSNGYGPLAAENTTVSDGEFAVAKAIGLDVEKYKEHRAQLREQLFGTK